MEGNTALAVFHPKTLPTAREFMNDNPRLRFALSSEKRSLIGVQSFNEYD